MRRGTRILPLDQAAAGMQLAEPALDAQGILLLAEGVQLTPHHMESLRRHNIASLTVVSVEDEVPAVELEAEREAARRRIERLFRHCRNDELNETLRQTLLDYRMEQLS